MIVRSIVKHDDALPLARSKNQVLRFHSLKTSTERKGSHFQRSIAQNSHFLFWLHFLFRFWLEFGFGCCRWWLLFWNGCFLWCCRFWSSFALSTWNHHSVTKKLDPTEENSIHKRPSSAWRFPAKQDSLSAWTFSRNLNQAYLFLWVSLPQQWTATVLWVSLMLQRTLKAATVVYRKLTVVWQRLNLWPPWLQLVLDWECLGPAMDCLSWTNQLAGSSQHKARSIFENGSTSVLLWTRWRSRRANKWAICAVQPWSTPLK